MSTFESFGRKAGHAANRIIKKSSDLFESGKVKLSITREQHLIDEAFYKIGEKIFKAYEFEEDVPAEIAAEVAEIKERKELISRLSTKVTEEEEEDAENFGEEVIIDITEDEDKE